MVRETADLRGAPTIVSSNGVIARLTTLLTGGTLATRLVVAGTLLMVGLPVLTILVHVWGYPPTPVTLPLVYLADGLQVLIVLNALVIAAQLVGRSRIRVPWVSSRRPQAVGAGEALRPLRRSGPVELRELCVDLAVRIWEQERKSGAVLGPVVLDYIRDAVTTELEHRRRKDVLERRLALALSLTPDADAEASAHDRR